MVRRLNKGIVGLIGGVCLLFLSLSTAQAESGSYKFDPKHTEVIFSYTHLGMSRAYARFNKVEGALQLNEQDPAASSIKVIIPVESIDTGVAAFDGHLKDKQFFDVLQFPNMTFESTSVSHVGGKQYKVAGNLTIKGITKPVSLDLTYIVNQKHPLGAFNPALKDQQVAAFSARTRILRSAWGMGQYAPATSDEVEIIIETEMFKQ